METKYWTKIRAFHGVELLRNPETFECRIVPIERPQQEPQTPAPVITPEMQARAEHAAFINRMIREAGSRSTAIQPEPQPMTFEEQIQHDWRYSPGIRKEFVSLASYAAYCRAVRDSKAKIYG